MPSGGTLAVSAERLDGRVRLTVSDTGDGMDAEALERVFEPYFSTKTGGTGLGLPIAKRNVELNGGTIALESRKGTGTTVTIELPLYREGPRGLTPPAHSCSAGVAATSGVRRRKRWIAISMNADARYEYARMTSTPAG